MPVEKNNPLQSHSPVNNREPEQKEQNPSGLFSRFLIKKLKRKTRLLISSPAFEGHHQPRSFNKATAVLQRTSINRDHNDTVFSSTSGHIATSTVPHVMMEPNKAGKARGITGKWHVKFPTGVRILETLKRKVVARFMKLMGKNHKSNYFNNKKTLAEREVLAGKMAQLASIRGPSYCQYNWEINKTPQIEVLLHRGETCVASKHFNHSHGGEAENKSSIIYDGEHNPASAYVMRRFFLGDEDAVKRDNYLVDVNSEGVHCFIPIDYGFAFYNNSDATENMKFEEFAHWVLQLPAAHKLHYGLLKRGDSIMDLIDGMLPSQKLQAVYMALSKIASLGDHEPAIYCRQISDPKESQRIYQQLQQKIATARRLVKEAWRHPDIQPLL